MLIGMLVGILDPQHDRPSESERDRFNRDRHTLIVTP
jgi:hypothetical protein